MLPRRPTRQVVLGDSRVGFVKIGGGKPARDGTPTTCHFGYSGPLSEAVLLGTVAYRVGERLEGDAAALKATNCPEADRLIRKPYRQGWEVA